MTVFVTCVRRPDHTSPLPLPVYAARVPAGFPSPADDHLESPLDLTEHLVQHPAATFLVTVAGRSMEGAGIFHGDTLVVDRSLEPRDKDIVVAAVDGELTVKRLRKQGGRVVLVAESPHYPSIELCDGRECVVWGVVTSAIHRFRK